MNSPRTTLGCKDLGFNSDSQEVSLDHNNHSQYSALLFKSRNCEKLLETSPQGISISYLETQTGFYEHKVCWEACLPHLLSKKELFSPFPPHPAISLALNYLQALTLHPLFSAAWTSKPQEHPSSFHFQLYGFTQK